MKHIRFQADFMGRTTQHLSYLFRILFSGQIPCLLWIALTTGLAVLFGEHLINRIYFEEPAVFSGTGSAIFGNILILFCFMTLLFTLINRLLTALLTGLLIYCILILSDILKLIYFDNPLRPIDLNYLADLRIVAQASLSTGTLLGIITACLAVIALIILIWKKEAPVLPWTARTGIGSTAAILITLAFTLPSVYVVREWLAHRGIAKPEAWQFEPRYSAQLNGILVEWAMGAADASFHRPERYSRPEIERIAHAYSLEPKPAGISKNEPPANLIIYVIESFMDPLDLGVHFTADPIPTFRAISRKYSSGKVVVPVFGGTSANTEFELLTGLSMYFLPDSSCPYRQHIMQDVPSLLRVLHQNGYQTTAIPADPPYLFNRKAAYKHMGFDHWIFPEADAKTPRSPDDEFAADEAIVDAVIAASRSGSPYFILAFTGGTHFPWEYSDYIDSRLDIVGPSPNYNRSKLKTYVNALKVADNSLKKLITYFEKTNQKTEILFVGDHLPPLGEIYQASGFFNSTELVNVQKRYQTPMAVWSNYPKAKEDFICSANFIPVRLLQSIGLRPTGSLALAADVYSHFPVLSKYVQTADGRLFAPQSDGMPFQQLIEDYRLIQYDLLLGKQYALEIWDNPGPKTKQRDRE
jgi:hypothetical protein